MPKICQINSFPFSCQILFHFFTPQFIEMKTNKTIESLTSFKPKSRVLFFFQVQVQAASEREERLNQYTSASKQPTKTKTVLKMASEKNASVGIFYRLFLVFFFHDTLLLLLFERFQFAVAVHDTPPTPLCF